MNGNERKMNGNERKMKGKTLAYFIARGFIIAFVHLPGQRVSDRKAIEKSSSTKKFREHQMEILYLGVV